MTEHQNGPHNVNVSEEKGEKAEQHAAQNSDAGMAAAGQSGDKRDVQKTGAENTAADQRKEPHTVAIPSEEDVEAERERLQYQKRYRQTLRTTIYALIVVAAVAVLLATMFLPVLQVSGTSMEPTLSDKDIILLVKTDNFETGDLIGFYYQNKLLLKRVIGGPGDIIDIDEEGNVYVNDELIDEPYISEKSLGETDLVYPYQVPESRYFVMGDNRVTSIDSRSSAIGCIEVDQIVGKVILRIWPFNRISLIQ